MAEPYTDADISLYRSSLEIIDRFLQLYKWLLNSYTTEFFLDDVEQRFPLSFRQELFHNCSFQELASLLPSWDEQSINNQPKNLRVLPLSMLCFRKLCLGLSLNQKPSVKKEKLRGGVFGTDLEKYFSVAIKGKKRHEIDILSELIESLCKQTGCGHVIDVGAGLGHLSRLLTYGKNLKVTTIEASETHTPKAKQLDKKTAEYMRKEKVIKESEHLLPPAHISHFIDSNITTEEFMKLIDSHRNTEPVTPGEIINSLSSRMNSMMCNTEKSENSSGTNESGDTLPWFDLPWKSCLSGGGDFTYQINNKSTEKTQKLLKPASCSQTNKQALSLKQDRICLSGLHACGDLSTTLLRVFVNLDCAKVISSVACCYMKMSHCRSPIMNDSASTNQNGFPMSQFVKSLPFHENIWSYESLEMGCHSTSEYRLRLINEESGLKRHAVRAALEKIISSRVDKNNVKYRRLRIKNSETLSFKQYAERAFARLGLAFDVSQQEIDECELLIQTKWRAVVGAYTVRLALSPLVEAYILLDRMVYLHEHGIGSILVPTFDPLMSPRNMVLIGSKDCKVDVSNFFS